jgi:hypothetical protein
MNKFLVFMVGLCISSFVFLMVSIAVTEGRPIARAAMGGIWILCCILVMDFVPDPDPKRETNLQKFVFVLELIIILMFIIFIVMIGMIDESLVESGYASSDLFLSEYPAACCGWDGQETDLRMIAYPLWRILKNLLIIKHL